MAKKKPTEFQALFSTIRNIYDNCIWEENRVPDNDYDFDELMKTSFDKQFTAKTAQVMNFVLGVLIMKMGYSSHDIKRIIGEIIEEQFFQIENTMLDFQDGPLNKNGQGRLLKHGRSRTKSK